MKKTKENLVDIFREYSPNKPLSKEMTMFCFNCMMSENPNLKSPMETIDKNSEEYKHFEELINAFTVQVFLKRLKALGNLDITLETLILLSEDFTSPGKAVMYAYYLHMMCPIYIENSVVTIEEYTKIFPMGTFSETQLNEIWNKQKVKKEERPETPCVGAPDNLIDYISSW
jgi:hypothetical protein